LLPWASPLLLQRRLVRRAANDEEHLREGQDALERPAAEVLHYRNDKGSLHVV